MRFFQIYIYMYSVYFSIIVSNIQCYLGNIINQIVKGSNILVGRRGGLVVEHLTPEREVGG